MRHTFTYTPDPENPHDHIRSVIETDGEMLEEVLEAMEIYLRAAGFTIDGELDVVKEKS